MEKALPNKTPALRESKNMGIWVCWYIKSSGKTGRTGKTPFFVVRPFCTHHSICLNIGF